MSESGVTSEKKVYRVSSAMKKVTMYLTKGSYSAFARNAVKIPKLKTALVAAVAALVRKECQDLCTTTDGLTSVLRNTSPGFTEVCCICCMHPSSTKEQVHVCCTVCHICSASRWSCFQNG